MAGDRAGKQNRQFIGALVERFHHFSDLVTHLVALRWPCPRPAGVATHRKKKGGPANPHDGELAGPRRDRLQGLQHPEGLGLHRVGAAGGADAAQGTGGAGGADKLLACGAKLNDGGEIAKGGIYFLDVDDRDTAEQFISHDPFTQADLFERVVITRWRKAYFNFESCLVENGDQPDRRK